MTYMDSVVQRLKASVLSLFAQVAVMVRAFPEAVDRCLRAQGFHRDAKAQIGMGPILGVVGGVVTFIVVLLMLAAFSGQMFGAVEDINENITDQTTGSTEADEIKPVFVILIAIGFLLALVTAVLGAAEFLRLRRE